MIGREIEILILEEEPENGHRNAISDNFIRVRAPEQAPVNEWIKVKVVALTDDGLQASLLD